MKSKLLFMLLWLYATGVSAQHLTLKNYQKKTPPSGLTEIAPGLYCDKQHITNVDWLEYLYWLEHIYGKESDEYGDALPDEQVLSQQLPLGIALVYVSDPTFRFFPVLGISPEQARAYCEWRTDRVAEWMLIHFGRMKSDSNPISVKKSGMPADLKTLYFFLPESNIETRYGFSCFAEWR